MWSASLGITTEHPRITPTQSTLIITHGFAGQTTFPRRTELKIRTPFHSISPQLQMINTSATLFVVLPTLQNTTIINKIRSRRNLDGSRPNRPNQAPIDHKAGRNAHEEDDCKRTNTTDGVPLPPAHLICRTEINDAGYWLMGFLKVRSRTCQTVIMRRI